MRAGWMHRWAARGMTVAAIALVLAGAVSCGQQNTASKSPSYIYIDSLLAYPGSAPNVSPANAVQSDVITKGAIYEDMAIVKLRMAVKDIGTANAPTLPTWTNSITVTRYHVDFVRADGRNTPGVDVPSPFDGGATATIDANGLSLTFVLVRAQAKLEMPLSALQNNGGASVISTIAYITFYGQDQNGNAVSVTGTVSVNFSDWADPVV